MKILLLSFYFEPDLCAGSFRNTALVEAMSKHLKNKDHLDIMTTMPNRYASYKAKALNFEEYASNVHVYRSELPEHKSGFFDQINSFKTYYIDVMNQVKNKDYDLVVASSSRLFTAFLGARLSSKKQVSLFLDIRDIFRGNMREIIKNTFLKYTLDFFLGFVENYTFKKANHINIVSEGFRDYFKKFNAPISFYPNGIDELFLMYDFKKNTLDQSRHIITYAGNIGDGQGLHKVIPQVAKLLASNKYIFRIIGDGGALQLLKEELDNLNIQNVELIDPVGRDELLMYYKETDYLFLHLNDYDAFKKVLPSKIFEYAATGKPIIAGVGGYAKEFLEKYVDGKFVFDPCDVKELTDFINNNSLSEQTIDRENFVNKFARRSIMDEMSEYIFKSYRDTND